MEQLNSTAVVLLVITSALAGAGVTSVFQSGDTINIVSNDTSFLDQQISDLQQSNEEKNETILDL